eukprot:m.320091 g.320091  ORF g.320091 m.320091 type:complete len:53 (-) comp15992_c3_seq4:2499-2657(-)
MPHLKPIKHHVWCRFKIKKKKWLKKRRSRKAPQCAAAFANPTSKKLGDLAGT